MSKQNKKKPESTKEKEVTTSTVTETTESTPEVIETEAVVNEVETPAEPVEVVTAPTKAAKKEKVPKAPKEPRVKKDKPVRETQAHMAKVDKYESSLPTLSEAAKAVFTDANTLSSGDLNVLAAHIALLARKRATASAATVKLKEGDHVRIHSGIDTRFIGKEGVVTRCQRIRIFVRVPGFGKDAYLFASNVDLIEADKIDVNDDAIEDDDAKTATG